MFSILLQLPSTPNINIVLSTASYMFNNSLIIYFHCPEDKLMGQTQYSLTAVY